MQRKTFFEFRWGFIALSAVLLAACGGGGGGGSAGDANTPQTIKSTPENLQVAVQSAVMHANVKVAGTLLTRSTPTGQEFIDTKNSGFSVGDVFIFQRVGYKIIGIISSADGSQRITTQPAALKEIYSDLNVNVKTNALAYDESGKPITFSQLGLIKRTGMQLGLANPLGAIKKCVQIKGDVSTESASEGNKNNFGYEFTAACTLGELLDIDALNAVNISGTFRYSATTEYIIKLEENSNYTVSDSDLGGDLTVKLEAASFAKISELTKNSDKCKSKDGAIECKIEVFKTPEKWIVIGGVPIGLQAGLRIKITINADGTATLTFKNGSVHTAGLVNGLEKNERVNKPDSGTSFAPLSKPDSGTSLAPLSFSGELDVYIYGFASATAIGLSTQEMAVVNGEISLGAFGTLSAELPVNTSKGCIKFSTGIRAGVELEVLKFGSRALFELNGVHSTTLGEKSIPASCDTSGKINLNYVIPGKNYYTENVQLSTGTMDFYDVSFNLFKLQSDALGSYFSITTTPSIAVIGKPLAFEITIKDFSKNPNIRITKVVSGLREDLTAKIYPGQNTYGDVIKLEMRAYVPGDRAKTELVREIQMKIEAPLEARPTYWKEIDTTGNAHWVLDHGFLGDTRARLKNAVNKFAADGTVNILSHPYTVSVGGVASDVSYFDTTSISALSRNSVINTPISIGLSSAALKAGSEQLFQYVESTQPGIKTVTYEPRAPQLGDVIAFTVKGDRLPLDMKVTIPNCKYIDERRTKENLQTNTFSTIERVYYCKNTATGVDLVAEFGATPYPVVFSVVEQSTADFVSVPKNPGVGETVAFHLYNIWSRVETVMWSIYGYTLDLVTQVKEGATSALQAYVTPGVKTIAVAYRDSDGTTLRSREYSVTVGADLQSATIDAAVSNSTTKPGPVPNNGTTDDTTPTLSGTISAPLVSGQNVNVWDGANRLDPAAVVTPGGTTWTFTPATPLIGGLHSFTAEVADFQGIPGARSAAYVVNVLSTSVASVSPGAMTRTLPGSFDIVGRDLPTSGISVSVPGDAKAVCQAPNNLTASGFKVACQFYKLGAQTLEIRTATALLGTVTVNVKTNVTGVTWTSPSTTSSGTVKFGETVAFKVAGVNMLADPTMGFAVQLCGVSNTEVGTPSNTLRTFSCNFNNTAGAVAGQMPGVVKDALGGQVLFDGWNVPVEVPVATNTIDLPAIAFVRGVSVALSGNGYGADALMNAPPYGAADNSAEWDFTVPVAGRYELFATYASGESRPVMISFDGNLVFGNALAASTGGYFPSNRQTFSQGFVDLAVGARVMRVAETGANVFPHIKGFTLVPVALIEGSFQVNANARLGTSFTVPNGVTSCTFNATGNWLNNGVTSNANGDPTFPRNVTLYLQSAYFFSLIAKSTNGYQFIGVSQVISVAAGQTFSFMTNEGVSTSDFYYDNSGSLLVSYTCH